MDIESKSFKFLELKVNEETGILTGYCATWQVDQGYDRIVRGAFSNSIAEKFNKRKETVGNPAIRVLWQHKDPIGVLLECREDDYGVFVKAKILQTTLGKDAIKLIAAGAVDCMSIGYVAIKSHDEDGVRVITELDWHEFSPVTFPMNEGAVIVGIKSYDNGPDLETMSFKCVSFKSEWKPGEEKIMPREEKSGAAISKVNRDKLAAIYSQIGDLLSVTGPDNSGPSDLTAGQGHETSQKPAEQSGANQAADSTAQPHADGGAMDPKRPGGADGNPKRDEDTGTGYDPQRIENPTNYNKSMPVKCDECGGEMKCVDCGMLAKSNEESNELKGSDNDEFNSLLSELNSNMDRLLESL